MGHGWGGDYPKPKADALERAMRDWLLTGRAEPSDLSEIGVTLPNPATERPNEQATPEAQKHMVGAFNALNNASASQWYRYCTVRDLLP